MQLEIGKWVNNANIEIRKRPTCANRTRCSTRVDYLQCNDVIVGWGVCVSICYDLRSFTLLLEMSHRIPNKGSEAVSESKNIKRDGLNFWPIKLLDSYYENICSSCASKGFTTEVGCDYPGKDIQGMGTYDFDACVKQCKTISNCKVAMWNNGNKYCFTKYDITSKRCTNLRDTVGRKCALVSECGKLKWHYNIQRIRDRHSITTHY